MSDPNASMSWPERVARHGLSEIASTPGAVPGLVGLAEMGVRWASGDELERAALSKDGRVLYDVLNHDNAPEEMQRAAMEMFDPQKHLNWGLRGAQEWYEFGTEYGGNIDRKLGLSDGEEFTRDAGDVPLDEEIAGIALAALPGLPAKVITKLGQKIANKFGQNAAAQFVKRVAQTTPGKISGRIAGATGYLVPGTFPWTKTNFAINTGAQVALNDVMRNIGGETSLIGYSGLGTNPTETPEERAAKAAAPNQHRFALNAAATEVAANGVADPVMNDPGPTHGDRFLDFGTTVALGGITIGGLLALAMRGRAPNVTAGVPFNPSSPTYNRNLTDQNDKLTQIIGTRATINTRLFDSDSAIRKVGQVGAGEQYGAWLEAQTKSLTAGAAEAAARQVLDEGIEPLSGVRTIPGRKIASMIDALDNRKPFSHGVNGLEGADTKRGFFEMATMVDQELIERAGLRQEASDIVVKRQKELAEGIANGVSRQRRATLQKRLTRAQDMEQASAHFRAAFDGLTTTDLKRIQALRDADPDLKRAHETLGQFYYDMAEVQYRLGIIDLAEKQRRHTKYGKSYRPMKQRTDPDITSKAGRLFRSMTDRTLQGPRETPRLDSQKKRGKPAVKHYEAVLNNKVLPVVNSPVDSISMMIDYAGNLVRQAYYNKARVDVIEFMEKHPKTRNALRERSSMTLGQFKSGNYPEGQGIKDHYLTVMRNGRVKSYEFADDVLRASLDFAPSQVVPVLNESRRIAQAGLTGPLRPLWSIKGFMFDYFAGHATRPKGRYYGFTGIPGDPTAILDSVAGVGRLANANVTKAIGEWFVNDLAEGNGLFAKIAQSAAGRQALEDMGNKALARYFRTTAYILQGQGRFGNAASVLTSPQDLSGLHFNASQTIAARVYMGLLDSVHNGVKMGYFARNYDVMKRRYGGQVPQAELNKLVQETRELAGDPTKSPMSQSMNKVLSTVPYGNITIQSISHVLGGSIRRVAKGDPRPLLGIMNGVGIPAIGGLIWLNQMGPEATDWYYNKLPQWRRITNIFIPNPLSKNDSGVFDPAEDVLEVSLAPELVPLKEMMVSAAESMGLLEDESRVVDESLLDTFAHIDMLAAFMLPPAFNAALGAMGYRFFPDEMDLRGDPETRGAVRTDTIHMNSDMTKQAMNVVSALLGTFGRMAMLAVDSGNAALEEGDSMLDAGLEALDTWIFLEKKNAPIINKGLFGIDTQYSTTPITDKWYGDIDKMSEAFRMYDAEVTGLVGGKEKPPRITTLSDFPNKITQDVDGIPAETIRAAVVMSKEMLENGVVRDLTGEMARINRSIEMVRTNVTADRRKVHDRINELQLERQRIATQLVEHVLQPWERQMSAMLGKPVDAGQFISIMRKGQGE